MATQNLIHLGTASLLALAQRLTEDFSGHIELEGGDAAVTKAAQSVVDDARDQIAALEKQVETVVLNADLSDAGKVRKITEMVHAANDKLQYVKKAANTRADAERQARASLMATPPSKVGEVVDYMVGSEIRSRLSRLALSDRMKIVMQAVASGKTEIIRSIEMDPLGQELVDSDFLNRLKQERAQATDAVAWQRAESLKLVVERLNTFATAISLSLEGFGETPAFPSKPTRTSDFKLQDTQKGPLKSQAADKPAASVGALT